MHLLRRQAKTTHLIADCNPFTYCSGQLSWDCSSSKDISSCCAVIDLSYSDYPGFSWFLISETFNSNHNYIASYLAREQKNRKTFSILHVWYSRNMLSIQMPKSNQSLPVRLDWSCLLDAPAQMAQTHLTPTPRMASTCSESWQSCFQMCRASLNLRKIYGTWTSNASANLDSNLCFVCYLLADNLLSKTLFSEHSWENTREIYSERVKTQVMNPLLGSFGII